MRNPPSHLWLVAVALMGAAACTPAPEEVMLKHPDTARYQGRNVRPATLLGAFSSYAEEAVVLEKFAPMQHNVLRQRVAKAPSARYPDRVTVLLTIKGYQDLGQSGELELSFFNDRLMEAEFRPDDAEAYLAAWKRNRVPRPPRDTVENPALDLGPVRIYSNLYLASSRVGGNLRTKPVVRWSDRRLLAEREEWDERYGSIPEPTPKR